MPIRLFYYISGNKNFKYTDNAVLLSQQSRTAEKLRAPLATLSTESTELTQLKSRWRVLSLSSSILLSNQRRPEKIIV